MGRGALGPGGGGTTTPGGGGGRGGAALAVVGNAGRGAAQHPVSLGQQLETAVAGRVGGVTVRVNLGGGKGSRGSQKGSQKGGTEREAERETEMGD